MNPICTSACNVVFVAEGCADLPAPMSLALLPRSDKGPPCMATEPPLKIELPASERGRSAADIARFDKLKAELSSPRLNLNDKQRESRVQQLAELEAKIEREGDKAWAISASSEALALAAGRGEEVEQAPGGRIRITSHDPLTMLLEGGKLNSDQEMAGRECVELYEIRSRGVGSQMGALTSSGGGTDNNTLVMNGFMKAKRAVRIELIERTILIETSEANCLVVFRWVCDRQQSVRSMGGGRAYDRNCKSLARALDVANSILRGR